MYKTPAGGFCGDCVTEQDGEYFFVLCTATGWEGLWSTTESFSRLNAEWEHDRAEDDLFRSQLHAQLHRNAIHIYRTTEPGDPRRRGIGVYL